MYEITSISAPDFKSVRSKDYNYNFNKVTGYFERWGKTKDEDPTHAPFPEIADIEVSTICSGIGKLDKDGSEMIGTERPCTFCYKSNACVGTNMSFDTFKTVFDKLNKHRTLTQIAFGIGDISSNPDLFKIMEYTRENGVIPNTTVNGWGITDKIAIDLAMTCGAISVSHYNDDVCFNAIEKLTRLIGGDSITLNCVNIHQLLCNETYDECLAMIDKVKNDPRLSKMGSIVFLSLKPKGFRNKFTCITDQNKYTKLFNKALDSNINFGSDSCGAKHVLESFKEHTNYANIEKCVEGCESTCFSIYINVDGHVFPCSFAEGFGEWAKGINMLTIEDFTKDVWDNAKIRAFRHNNINKCCSCPIYKI